MRNQELAFLANTIAAGCSIQSRPFTLQEASDAAVAVCNLGLQNWPSRWLPAGATSPVSSHNSGTALPDDLLVRQDLIGVFQAGWTVLYEEVCMYAAKQTIDVLSHLRCTFRVSSVRFMFLLLLALAGPARGQEDAPPRLMDQTPFDILTLDKANDSKVYKIYPVRLPGRRVPEKPKATEKIRVKLIENDEEYDVASLNIVKLDLYEQMVLAEVH